MLQLLTPNRMFNCCKRLCTTETQLQRFEKRTFSNAMKSRLSRFHFLPKETMYIVKPYRPVADNVVIFHVPLKYTKFEIKNYLEQIYGLKIARVNTMIKLGQTVQGRDVRDGKVKKRKFEDKKVAYVILAEGKFKFPELDSAFFTNEQLGRQMSGEYDFEEFDKSKEKKSKYPEIKGTVS